MFKIREGGMKNLAGLTSEKAPVVVGSSEIRDA